jgi:PTS system mannose-specific IIA component
VEELVKVVLISHGPFCEGLLKSVEMIAGPQQDINALPLNPGENPDDYRDRLDKIVEDNTLILCDLKGGTPYNSAAFVSKNYDVSLVTGMNIPMVITLVTSRTDESSREDLVKSITTSTNIGVEEIDLNFKESRKHGKLSLNKNR